MSRPEEKNKIEPLLWAEINLKKLEKNLKAIEAHVRKSGHAKILAVVKADAYGHGMNPVAKVLWKTGVRFFGVANIDEALLLRKALPKSRILVLGSFHEKQIPFFVKSGITPTVSSLEDLKKLNSAVHSKKKFPVHIKIDTGMGRLGVWHEEVRGFFQKALNFKALEIEGIYTHFSCADSANEIPTKEQLKRFNNAIDEAGRLGIKPAFIHAANSLGLARFAGAHFNLVRPGIVLYGINPLHNKKLPFHVEPVLELKTRISFLKDVESGRSVSYGGTFTTKNKTRIATLPIGYSHGYRVGFSNKAFVLVNGIKCPVIGRVTMDQTLVDVGKANAKRWDSVTVIGRDGQAELLAADLASLIGTIPYEIVCAIHSRIPRIYKAI